MNILFPIIQVNFFYTLKPIAMFYIMPNNIDYFLFFLARILVYCYLGFLFFYFFHFFSFTSSKRRLKQFSNKSRLVLGAFFRKSDRTGWSCGWHGPKNKTRMVFNLPHVTVYKQFFTFDFERFIGEIQPLCENTAQAWITLISGLEFGKPTSRLAH